MKDPILDSRGKNETWNHYLDSLVQFPVNFKHLDFIAWCRDKEFESLVFATQVYAAQTGIVIKPQDLIPF